MSALEISTLKSIIHDNGVKESFGLFTDALSSLADDYCDAGIKEKAMEASYTLALLDRALIEMYEEKDL